jgi:LysR family transcriptional regulator (chromosome initiation inhibitor)
VSGPSWEVHTDDQDYTADLLRSGTAMAAVTAQNVVVQGCRVEPLGAMRYLPVGVPGTDISTSPLIAYNRKDALQHRFLASVAGTAADPPVHYVPGNVAFIEAIRLGLGWGMVPEQLALPDIAAGAYVRLLPDRHLDVPLFWQCWRIESAVLSELTAAVQETAAAALR